MRFIINYIRSCFCKHDFELVANCRSFDKDISLSLPCDGKLIYRCKKCGYTQKIKY